MRNSNSAFYEWISPRYQDFYGSLDADETVRQWLELISTIRPDLLPAAGRNRRLLDVGCGTGRHLAAWSQSGFDVAGLDGSPGMVKLSKSYLRSVGLPRIPVLVGDAGSSLFGRFGHLDLAVAHTNFFHLFPPQQFGRVARALATLMKPNGLLLFDWTSPALAGDGSEEVKLDSEGQAWRISGKLSSDTKVYTQKWQPEGYRGRIERYWLYTPDQCDTILRSACWRRVAARSWHPANSRSNWKRATSRSRRLVLAYERRQPSAETADSLGGHAPRTGVFQSPE